MWRIKPQLLMRLLLQMVMNEELGETVFPLWMSKVPL